MKEKEEEVRLCLILLKVLNLKLYEILFIF